MTAALEAWLAEQSMTEGERKDLLSYLRRPETKGEMQDAHAVATAALSTWDAWNARPTAKPRRGSPAR